jgi:hypothetical protein
MPALQILHILNFKNFSVSYFSKQAYHRAPGFVVHDLKGKKKWYEELRVITLTVVELSTTFLAQMNELQ